MKTIKKVGSSKLGKAVGKVIGKTPVGMGLDLAGGLFGGKKGGGKKHRHPSPQKMAKRLFHARMNAKIQKAKMSAYKGL
jgi:hypothetical protein